MDGDRYQLAVELELLDVDSADGETARSYWAVNPDGSWAYSVKDVAALAKVSQPVLNQRLRAVMVARDPETPCDQCGRGATAANRTEFEQNRRLAATARLICNGCRTDNDRAEKAAAAERQRRLVEEVSEKFGFHDQEPISVMQLRFREAVSLLALFRNPIDDDYTCSIPLRSWVGSSFTARTADGRDRLSELWNANLIVVHPSTPQDAFGWISKDDGEDLPGVHVDRVRWTARGSGHTGSINAALVKGIKQAASGSWPDSWSLTWPGEWDRVMLEESLAYLELCMDDHRLEFNPGERTKDVLSSALNSFSLGQVYNFVWRAVRDSAAYYQRGGVTRLQAANSTIGRIERVAERALAEKWEVKAYRRDRRLPWSAVSTTLFTTFLGLGDAMTATVEDVDAVNDSDVEESMSSVLDEEVEESRTSDDL
ncbi:hypothetical protein ACIODS_24410 [Micromonospora chalcea]|uniref:hypothetical protein n=1 Tax=Micromonospora chalcea TaxID=1874 RepID=UPI003801541A